MINNRISKKILSPLVLAVILYGCGASADSEQNSSKSEPDQASLIIDQAISFHGGDAYEDMNLRFQFRDKGYAGMRNKGTFAYMRFFTDSTGHIVDLLSNEGFERKIDGEIATLSEERIRAFSNSVNSVWYFALLPYGLQGEAVIKKYQGTRDISGKTYHEIRVSFEENGGGEDFEDVFLFWFDIETYSLDYLAYEYQTEGGGMRFREAFETIEIGPLKIPNYRNYKPRETSTLEQLPDFFMAGELELLSKIELEKIIFEPASE